MPKAKTNSSAKKRFYISGSGKIRRKKASKNHLLNKKSKSRKRRLSRSAEVHLSDRKTVRKLLNIG